MSAVRAAGGIIVRPDADAPRVALVYRSRYDDWTFPKGKADPGESDEHAAAREVEEETGLRCALGPELDTIHYQDRRGRPKVVRYWLMDVEEVTRDFAPDHEIDDLRWCTFAEADALLSYDRDRVLARRARERLES